MIRVHVTLVEVFWFTVDLGVGRGRGIWCKWKGRGSETRKDGVRWMAAMSSVILYIAARGKTVIVCSQKVSFPIDTPDLEAIWHPHRQHKTAVKAKRNKHHVHTRTSEVPRTINSSCYSRRKTTVEKSRSKRLLPNPSISTGIPFSAEGYHRSSIILLPPGFIIIHENIPCSQISSHPTS